MSPEPTKFQHLAPMIFALAWMFVCYISLDILPHLCFAPAPWWLPFILAIGSVAGAAYNVGVAAGTFRRITYAGTTLKCRGGAVLLHMLVIIYLYSEFIRILESS